MTRNEAIRFLHEQIKNADAEKLRQIICGCFSLLCSNDCPLRQSNSCNCEAIVSDKN